MQRDGRNYQRLITLQSSPDRKVTQQAQSGINYPLFSCPVLHVSYSKKASSKQLIKAQLYFHEFSCSPT